MLISAENEIRLETTIAKQCTGERNHLFPFLMKKIQLIRGAFYRLYLKLLMCFRYTLSLKG